LEDWRKKMLIQAGWHRLAQLKTLKNSNTCLSFGLFCGSDLCNGFNQPI
jgi:hypothetical protein